MSGGEILRPGVDTLHIGEPQIGADLFQEVDALVQGVQQGDLQGGRQNFQGQAGEARTGAHVDEGLVL